MAVSAQQPGSSRPPLLRARMALAAATAALCIATVALIGWLIVVGGVSLFSRALNPWSDWNIWRPLTATLYVLALSLPATTIVGGLAAIGSLDARALEPRAAALTRALATFGVIPTIVVAFALLLLADAARWTPSLTAGAFALALVNMPVMAAVMTSVLENASSEFREAASALGASPGLIIRSAILRRAWRGLGAATLLIATNLVGGAAAIALLASARLPGTTGQSPIGAWPLAVHVWLRGTDADAYHVIAAAALLLTVIIWVLQGPALLRSSTQAEEEREA